jgi:mRNA interferase MazF
MRRGEVWTVAGGGGPYSGKPRPCVIIQDDRYDATVSITVCLLTSDPTDVPLVRPLVEPSPSNGLIRQSRVEVDKITTTRRSYLGKRLGQLSDEDMIRLNRAVLVFLGFGGQSE